MPPAGVFCPVPAVSLGFSIRGPATAVAPDATGLRQSRHSPRGARKGQAKDPSRWQTYTLRLSPRHTRHYHFTSHISPRRRLPFIYWRNWPNPKSTVPIGAGYCSDDVGCRCGDGDGRLPAGNCGSQHVPTTPRRNTSCRGGLTRDSPDPVTFRGLHVLTYHRDDFHVLWCHG